MPSGGALVLQAVALVALFGLPENRAAAEARSRGDVSLETRAFEPDDLDSTEEVGLALRSGINLKARTGPWQGALRGFARVDSLDDSRNIVVLEDAYAAFNKGPLVLSAGAQILNWTATEAFHPADVINSRNFDSDVENFEKLGEPMASLRLRLFNGHITAYYMPMRIEPNLLSATTSRLSLLPRRLPQAGIPGLIDLGEPLWLDRDGRPSDSLFANQGAVRIAQTFGRADISVQAVHHNDRNQPTLTLNPESGKVRPTYHMVNHLGLTYVHALGGLLIKLEAAYRSFYEPEESESLFLLPQADHAQAAAGLEYGWTNGAGHDATVILEGQGIVGPSDAERDRLHPFQGDVLFGYRHVFNDVAGRELTAVLVVDVERPQEYAASAQYSQRITDRWTVEGALRSLRILETEANQVQLSVTRHF